MSNTEGLTLNRLLSLKRRREQSQRAALATLALREIELQDSTTQILDLRRDLWEQWRNRSDASQVLDYKALQELKVELAHYNQQDHSFTDQLDTLQTEWSRLRIEQAERQTLLRKLLVEQEKLKMLLE